VIELLTDPKLHDEPGRVAALHRYEVLDTPREQTFDRITELVRVVLNVPICAVSLVDTDRQWFKSCVGLDTRQTSREVSFCNYTIQAREPFYIPDAKLDSRFAENPLVTGDPFIRSYLGVPLSTPDGYNVGSLCAIDVVPRNYSPEQIEILKSFAAVIVDELELRRIAQTDHLTGAATRRGFTLELEKALSRFKRSGHPTTLILLDIDHFKRVNDTYGHPAGDLVLKFVAQAMASKLRQGDSVGRLGGEEFGILLQDTAPGNAMETVERLRMHLERSPIDHKPPMWITASFGVAILDGQISSVLEWLATADAALYEAKRDGRNRCCIAKPVEIQAAS
jgi:diguanylate cyclase (GGDEF)-like protein